MFTTLLSNLRGVARDDLSDLKLIIVQNFYLYNMYICSIDLALNIFNGTTTNSQSRKIITFSDKHLVQVHNFIKNCF